MLSCPTRKKKKISSSFKCVKFFWSNEMWAETKALDNCTFFLLLISKELRLLRSREFSRSSKKLSVGSTFAIEKQLSIPFAEKCIGKDKETRFVMHYDVKSASDPFPRKNDRFGRVGSNNSFLWVWARKILSEFPSFSKLRRVEYLESIFFQESKL